MVVVHRLHEKVEAENRSAVSVARELKANVPHAIDVHMLRLVLQEYAASVGWRTRKRLCHVRALHYAAPVVLRHEIRNPSHRNLRFAARYDGDPSVAFVDIGSFGMYGEGHTGGTSKLSRAETERISRLHMELHRKWLPHTYLVISDDVAGSNSKAADLPLLQFTRSLGIGLRDDSLMCSKFGWYHDHWGRLFAPTLPVVLETGHYTLCSTRGNWRKDRILESVEKHQASYFTFHGFPEDFRESHAEEIAAVNRRIGYRLVPEKVSFPDEVKLGAPVEIAAEWVNKGVAPCLPGGFVAWSLVDAAGNVCWSFTDEGFDVRTLAPTLEAGPQPVRRVSCGRFGCRAPIPSWNDQVLEDLRQRGRVTETSFDMLSPGEYALCVSVGTRQGTPKIALPLAGGNARRYPIGKVVLQPSTKNDLAKGEKK